MVHRALQVLLCCLGPKEQVNIDNLHLNIKYCAVALLECKEHVAGMKGDGVFPQ